MISNELRAFLDNQDWGTLYRDLTTHTIRRLYWAGLNPQEGISGMDPSNIISEVIEAVYTGIRNPTLKDVQNFKKYLCWAINSVISGIKEKEKRKGTSVPYENILTDEQFFEQVSESAFFTQDEKEIDIIPLIEDALQKHDEEMYFVFSELTLGKKHKAIAESFGWTVAKVENVHKRITTFMKNYKIRAEKIQA